MTKPIFSKTQKKTELFKCGTDPLYFINNYCKIVHQEHGKMLFKTYPFQDECVESFIQNKLTLIAKARQLGCSTIVGAFIAWVILFHRNKEVLIVATQQLTAKNLLKKVKLIVKWLPDWLTAEVGRVGTHDNETVFTLTNGSTVKASATSSGAIRSEALALLVIDEAAHIDNMDELWLAMKPTIATGGKCIALSTPAGAFGWFYETFKGAEQGLNDWNVLKFDWKAHPDRDDEWYKQTRKDLPASGWRQEFEVSFEASGRTFIEPENIAQLEESIIKPDKTGFVDGKFWYWANADKNTEYMLTIDVARGDGGDSNVLDVWELSTLEQVAQYSSNELGIDLFSGIVFQAYQLFGKDPLVVVDGSTYGHDFCRRLQTLGCKNLYFSAKGSSGEYVPQWKAETMRGNVSYGLTMTATNRLNIYNLFEEYVRNKKVVIHSRRTFEEVQTFIWKDKKPQAASGKCDDTITTAAMACYVKENYFKDVKNKSVKQASLLNAIYRTTGSLAQVVGNKINKTNQANSELAKYYKKFSWVYRG